VAARKPVKFRLPRAGQYCAASTWYTRSRRSSSRRGQPGHPLMVGSSRYRLCWRPLPTDHCAASSTHIARLRGFLTPLPDARPKVAPGTPSAQRCSFSSASGLAAATGSWAADGVSAALIQAGTINRNSTSAVGTLFWELYCLGTPSVTGCNSVQTPGNYTASAGDDVSVSVSYNPATLMSYYHVAINGALDINVQYQMHSGTNSGNVADLITEHVSGYTLPNFGQLQFSSSRTYTTWNGAAYVLIGNQNYFAWELTSDNQFYTPSCSQSRILAYPLGITGGDFKNQFCRNS
jgi:hypothetical protein